MTDQEAGSGSDSGGEAVNVGWQAGVSGALAGRPIGEVAVRGDEGGIVVVDTVFLEEQATAHKDECTRDEQEDCWCQK